MTSNSQTGWGTQEKLLKEISKQLERLIQIMGVVVTNTATTTTTAAPVTTTTTTAAPTTTTTTTTV